MPERIRIDETGGLPVGSQKVYSVAGRRVAVFNVGGTLHAIDDACPHRGASLGEGRREGLTVTCPLHGWAFDVGSGLCEGRPDVRVQRFDVFPQGESLLLDLTPRDEEPPAWDGVYRYLIRYGAMGWVRWFGSIEKFACGHRDLVLVHTDRGWEAGEVLSGPADSGREAAQKPAGEVVRPLTPDEITEHRHRTEPSALVERCRQRLRECRVEAEILDAERLFDGETVVLYYLGPPDAALDGVADELEAEFALRVLFHPVIDPPAPAGGCGTGGCGCRAG